MAPPYPIAAKPTKKIFDPFNSSATGHQRADNNLSGSTSWRDSRTLKLGEQFRSGRGGGRRLYDTVGAGSEHFGTDGRLENGSWKRGASGLRKGGQLSLWESVERSEDGGGLEVRKVGVQREEKRMEGGEYSQKRRRVVEDEDVEVEVEVKKASQDSYEDALLADVSFSSDSSRRREAANGIPKSDRNLEEEDRPAVLTADGNARAEHVPTSLPQIFANLTIYINGSTAPTISDHKLKHLLSTHGANLSIALGRRTVTHVILGHPNGTAGGKGAGGGLASSKIHKEITKVGGKGVKFVSVEWVLESIRRGKRVNERAYECLRLAPKGMKSVGEMFGKC